MLIDVHCSLSLSAQAGTTPLMAASFYGHVDVVRVLIEAHADVNKCRMVLYIFWRLHVHLSLLNSRDLSFSLSDLSSTLTISLSQSPQLLRSLSLSLSLSLLSSLPSSFHISYPSLPSLHSFKIPSIIAYNYTFSLSLVSTHYPHLCKHYTCTYAGWLYSTLPGLQGGTC